MRERRRRRNKIFIITLLVLVIAVVGGIGAYSYISVNKEEEPVVDTSGRDINKDKIKIVTSSYPVFVATNNQCLGISNLSVENLTANAGGCIHDYQLTTDDMKKLADADMLIINGAGLEPFMDKIKAEYPDLQIVDASQDVGVMNDNSHYWLSIKCQRKACKNINNAIGQYYDTYYGTDDKSSDNYTQYNHVKKTLEKNYNSYDDKLLALANTYRSYGSSKVGAIFLSNSLLYFTNDTCLSKIRVVDLEDGAQASAAEISSLCKYMNDKEIHLIVAESSSSATAETIAKNTGARIIYLDTFTSGEAILDAYINTMTNNGKAIDSKI